jgi:hypothetical protein
MACGPTASTPSATSLAQTASPRPITQLVKPSSITGWYVSEPVVLPERERTASILLVWRSSR